MFVTERVEDRCATVFRNTDTGWFSGLWHRYLIARQEREAIARLARSGPHLLADIGLPPMGCRGPQVESDPLLRFMP